MSAPDCPAADAQAPDTQWPRWEVFKQDAPGKPHQAVGSVHAADSAHALLTARSVFARRPSAVSLWVAPASAIYSRTAEELAQDEEGSAEPNAEKRVYLVFRKASQRRSMAFMDYVGAVAATSAPAALMGAQRQYPDPPGLAWWVLPAGSLTQSDDDDATIESWFAPAAEKTYKQQSAYGVVGQHASVRKRGEPRD